MKLLALVENPEGACCRYRVRPFGPALEQLGIQMEIAGLAKSPWRRVRQLLQAGRADGVLLQRKLLPIWQLLLLRWRAGRLMYDVDDALFQRDSYHPKGAESWQRAFGFWAAVYAADAVLAGNPFLADRVARYIGPQRVYRVPTCVDSRRYPIAQHQRAGAEIMLVWIGQARNLPSLQYVQPALAEAARRIPGLSVRVICDQFPRLEGIQVLPYPWSAETETLALAEADIGICWLPPDTWSLGKCGLKVLQYMAAGLPVVANPVGIHQKLIQHGKTGFLAEGPAEWAEAIGRLASDPALRHRMGQQARAIVEREYDQQQWASRWARIVAGVLRPLDQKDQEFRKGFQEQEDHLVQSLRGIVGESG
jgi:glycosyltransferase involved in cell wall biosynthesis